MPNIVSVSELKNFKVPGQSAPLDFSLYSDEDLSGFLDYSEKVIQEGTGHLFYIKDDVVYASGKEKNVIFLPQDAGYIHPIHTVNSLQEVDFDKTTVLTEYEEGTDFQYESYYIYLNNQPVPVRRAVGGYAEFPKGIKNIKIDGSFGFEAPEDVKRAILWYAVVLTLGSKKASFPSKFRDHGYSQQVWTDYTVSYGASGRDFDRMLKNTPNVTGFMSIDMLLRGWINTSDIISVL